MPLPESVTRQPQKFLVGLLHIPCQTPIVIARWSLSGKHQHGWLGVIILLRLRCRKKYIFLVFSEWKFWKVKRTFLTPSRQPLSQFSWNLASSLSDSFSRKPCRRFLFSFSVSNNRHFFERSAADLFPLTLSYCHNRTNARIKNLRHDFLIERVKRQMRCLSFSSAHS